MICLSNTTCRTKGKRQGWLARIGACALLALAVLQNPATAAMPEQLVSFAISDIARGDGIAAQAKLERALANGARKQDVAAYMGEALIEQGELRRARQWLSGRAFSPASAARGFRALARLEQLSRNLPAAGRAFDRAIELTPRDATMWVEIGRLRYAGGEHLLAIEASDYAIQLDSRNVRALEFRGQIVRDRDGLGPSIRWFEMALEIAPDDISVLGEYAATLGELGRARKMLSVARRMLELDPGNARAYYLQAVMAARAGNYGLARRIFSRTGDRLEKVPGAMLLDGILQLAEGNYTLAAEAFDRLVRRQAGNGRAKILLARALYLSEEHDYLIKRFAADAARKNAPAYLQVLIGRAHEAMGRRGLAGIFLDKAAARRADEVRPVRGAGWVGKFMVEGETANAYDLAVAKLAANPGNFDNLAQAGDAALLTGNALWAMEHYAKAARIRMPENLLARRVRAMQLAGRQREVRNLVDDFLSANPKSRQALLISAGMAESSTDWKRASRIYAYLNDTGARSDVHLLSRQALSELRAGDLGRAEQIARRAYRLQRSNPQAAEIWGLVLAASGRRTTAASALLDKAESTGGHSPTILEARRILISSTHRQ